jgi:hypothetical protein
MNKEILIRRIRHSLKAFMPARILQAQLHRRVFVQFAEKIGLVYFGYVNQRNDEHRLVRGLTVSSTHRDDNYCIGTFRGYDVTLVERSDTIRFPGKPTKRHNWIIMTFDLHAPVDAPHVFMGLHTHSDTFYAHLFTTFSHLNRVPLGASGTPDPAFIDKYALYAEPAQAAMVEYLFDHELTQALAQHFGSFTLEIFDGSVYLYAEHQRPTSGLLERMLKNGLWLAQSFDERLERTRRTGESPAP